MTTVLGYDDLKMDRVDTILSTDGELFVALPAKRAGALIAFIEATRTTQDWQRNKTPFMARLIPLAKGLGTTVRITVMHSRLFELGRVVVLNASSQTWENLPNGQVMFRFVR